jgi:predicted TIM-barrel fold metal-dependent hydrolase
MKGPDTVFGLIKFYLARLTITKADKILFGADGARWIWNRVSELIKSLGLAATQFYSLVDFYHAVEHLAKIADLRTGWKKAPRKK